MLPDDASACLKLLAFLASAKHADKQRFFAVPVQAVLSAEEWEAYTAVISRPRDLGTIQKNLEESPNSYSTPADFVADVNMCFDNAIQFNQTRYPHVASIATQIKKVFNAEVDKRGLLQVHAGTSITPAKTSTIRLSASKKGTSAPPSAPPKLDFDSKPCESMVRTAMAADATARLFTQPVDETVLPGYRKRIDNPMDLGTLSAQLHNKTIRSPEEFAVLMRRIFANALRFNYRLRGPEAGTTKAIRAHAKSILFQFEAEWKATYPNIKRALPELKECLVVIDDLMKVPSTDPGTVAAADSFIDPIPKYYADQYPDKYLEIVKKPMDIGTVISNVIEGCYASVEEMRRDMLLVFSNCEAYLNAEGVFYIQTLDDDAKALRKKFITSLEANVKTSGKQTPQPATAVGGGSATSAELVVPEAASRIVIKKKGQASSASALSAGNSSSCITPSTAPPASTAPSRQRDASGTPAAQTTGAPSSIASPAASSTPAPVISKPRAPKIVVKDKYLWCLEQLRLHYIQGPVVQVRTADPFLKAVDPTKYAGYAEIVLNPMDLTSIERKVRGDRYPTMSHLLRDVRLIRHNTYLYNTGIEGLEIRVLADHLVFNFTYLLTMVASEIALSALPRDSPQCAVVTDEVRDLALKYHGPESVPVDFTPASSSIGKEVLGLGIQEAYLEQPEPTNAQLKAVRDFYSSLLQTDAQTEILTTAPPPKPKPARQSTGSKSLGPVVEAVSHIDQQSISDLYKDTQVLFSDSVAAAASTGGGKVAKGNVASKVSRKSSSNLSAVEQDDAVELVPDINPAPMELGYLVPVPPSKPLSEWELSCLDVVKKLLRHEFVDLSKPRRPGSMVCDFIYPVIQMYPSIAEKYLEIIKKPMDLTTVRSRLDEHSFLDCDDFYENITLVFQNAVDYNRPHASESEDAARLVPRCEHMIQYVRWLCLEYLPCKDDSSAASEEEAALLGPLRKSIQKREREFRTNLLKTRAIDDPRECNALLKKFENRKFIKEYIFFAKPVNLRDVPNYSNFVRRPMDFSTIKGKLESSKYPTYFSLIEDIELIFNNAKRFNGAFQESDPISKRIYEAAEFFQEKLNQFVSREFSIDVSERHIWNDFKLNELGVQRLERQKALDRQRLEDAQFRQQEVERLKKIDQAFAIDQDRELKRAYALENIPRPTERAARSLGVGISAGFSFEDKERRLQAEAALRDQMFEAAWARWTAHYGAEETAAELKAAEAAAAKAKEEAASDTFSTVDEISGGTPPSKKKRTGEISDTTLHEAAMDFAGHVDELRADHKKVVLPTLLPGPHLRLLESTNIPSVFGGDTDIEAESSDESAMDVCENRLVTTVTIPCDAPAPELVEKSEVLRLHCNEKVGDCCVGLNVNPSSNRRIILHEFRSDTGMAFVHVLVPEELVDSNALSIGVEHTRALYRLGTHESRSICFYVKSGMLGSGSFSDVLGTLRERACIYPRADCAEYPLGSMSYLSGLTQKYVLMARRNENCNVSFEIDYERANLSEFLEDSDALLWREHPGLLHLRGGCYVQLADEAAVISSACHHLRLHGGGISGDFIGHWLVLPRGSRVLVEAPELNRFEVEL